MDSAERQTLAERVVERSRADQVEVIVTSERMGLTRFTHNAIHQNLAQDDVTVRIRSIVGDRTGVATTNDLSEGGLAATNERAQAMAGLAPPESSPQAMVKHPSAPQPAGAFDAATAGTSAQERARLVRDIFASAQRSGLWAAGFARTSHDGITIANSAGTRASFDRTAAVVNIKQNGSDSSGFAEQHRTAVAGLDAPACAEAAAQKALGSHAPSTVEPGEWTVILEPAAFGELLAYLTDHFSAQAYDDGSSFLAAGLGQRYAAEQVTIFDDVTHPANVGMPFDYEGAPTQRVALFDRGIAGQLVTDSRYAHKLGRANTGHALPAPNAEGPQASHVVVHGGPRSREELIAQTKRGLLVSRFWYIRTVDQRQTIVTGMTRDGTFLIEDGTIGAGVRNMRFNQSILESLRHCQLAGDLTRTGGYSYTTVVPTAKIEGFRFSSGTDF